MSGTVVPWLPVSPNQDRPAAIPAALARYIGTVTQGMSMQAARRYRITPELENLERHGQASTTRLLQVLYGSEFGVKRLPPRA